MREYLIYGLLDPETLLVRYVGRTVQKLSKRVQQHRNARHTAYVTSWIKSLKSKGLHPEGVVLEQVDRDSFYAAECWWIAYGRALGWDLTNLTIGGDGQPPERTNSLSAREKQRLKMIGVPKSEEHCRSMSLAKSTPEAIAALKTLHIGRKRPQSTRDKIGAASRRRVTTEEARHNMSVAGRAKPPKTQETKNKLSASHKGKKFSPEHVANMASARRGKTASEETKRRMSESHKARWAVLKGL